VVGSISMFNAPSTFENITIPRDLDLEVEIAWKLLKTTLNLNKKEWILQHRLSMPKHFLVVNDGRKLNIISVQATCVV
jgi:hypothetical protein